jgi:hypothetical protein
MATWTAEKRRKLDAASFGDPEHRLFPVVDQEDLDSAARLIGRARNPAKVKARLIAIARKLGLKIPDAWKDDAAMSDGQAGVAIGDATSVAMFDLGKPRFDGDSVIYEDSLLFRCGKYEDRAFEMSPEEAWLAVDQFEAPVPNELEHLNTLGIQTIIDGKFGEVREIRLSEDGEEVRGTVAIPQWLYTIWEGPQKSVSAVWDRTSKTLKKLGLVVQGRVPDAALMAAFSAAYPSDADALFVAAHNTPHGRKTIQVIHDIVARAGAVCQPMNGAGVGGALPDDTAAEPGTAVMSESALFTSLRERGVLQTIHNAAVKGGAVCAISRGAAVMSASVEPTSIATSIPTSIATSRPNLPSKVRFSMPLRDKFLALFGRNPEAAPPEADVDAFLADLTATVKAPAEKPTEKAPVAFCDSPEFKALQEELERLKAELKKAESAKEEPAPGPVPSFSDSPEGKELRAKIAKLEQDNLLKDIATAAAAFAAHQIEKDHRALPAERAAIVAQFTQAALDDHEHSTSVSFSNGGTTVTGSRLDVLKASFDARPRHSLMREFVDGKDIPAGSAVLFHNASEQKSEEISPERMKKLLQATDLGREKLRRDAQGAHN